MDRDDVEKIKRAVEGKEDRVSVYDSEEKPSEIFRETETRHAVPTIKAKPEMGDRDVVEVKPETPGPTEFAPLFVKVEKYREAIIDLQELKSYLAGIKEIFEVVKELEELRQTSVEMVLSSIEKVETVISDLDMLLLKPPGVRLEGYAKGMEDVEKIELSMLELHKEIEALRERLAKLKAK